MKLKYFKSKTVCALLIFIILFQSCAVYHKDSVSLEEAVASNGRVKVTKNDESKLKFKKIELVDGEYYGLKKNNGEREKIPLVASDLKAIHTLNKTSTTWGNIGIAVGSLVVVFAIVAAISLQDGFNLGTTGF